MNFARHFLLSTDNLRGSFFAESVILLCKHDEDGAFGIVVNKPSPTKVRDLLRALHVREQKSQPPAPTPESTPTPTPAPAPTRASNSGDDDADDQNRQPEPIYISPRIDNGPVMQGGPVKPEQVFVIHSPEREYEATIKVDNHIAVTLSRDILAAIAQGQAPRKILFAFGYAGWGEGQLENEISQNAWITIPATPEVVFDLPAEQRLPAALKQIGFDISKLADSVGNA